VNIALPDGSRNGHGSVQQECLEDSDGALDEQPMWVGIKLLPFSIKTKAEKPFSRTSSDV
jgi:hypothetical protein